MAADRSFLGVGWGFPPRFDKSSGKIDMAKEEEDIRESLFILLSTAPGERVMRPAYGCDLQKLVFAAVDESLITEIKDLIRRAVLFFEPRVILDDILISYEDIYSGLLRIELQYRIIATNSRANMVYPFYFREGSNIR
jgi:phage baseplate assembly protein W